MSTFKTLSAIAALTIAARAAVAGGCIGCPECGKKVCKVTWEETKEKKHGYEVQCEDVCIKPIRLPWQMCCDPKCGRVRTVAVLKKVDYECESCKYKWEVTSVGTRCCGDSCGCPAIAARITDCAKNTPPTKKGVTRISLPLLSLFKRHDRVSLTKYPE